MKIDIETLRKTKGIGSKTLERIIEQHNLDNDLKAYKSTYKPSETYKIDKDINLWQGDCIELMEHIPDKSVDMILCDLPYGTTACSWDTVIPFKPLWSHYKRIIKDNGAIVLFGSEPFSTRLRMSNFDWYKYDWVWDKKKPGSIGLAKWQPMRYTENVLVFYRNLALYNPQMIKREQVKLSRNYSQSDIHSSLKEMTFKKKYTHKYPSNVLEFSNANQTDRLHPTQKPVKLLEYLIKTYTDEGMIVLDNCMGSGSTGVACKNTNRKFIGIELDEEYFNIAKERILDK